MYFKTMGELLKTNGEKLSRKDFDCFWFKCRAEMRIPSSNFMGGCDPDEIFINFFFDVILGWIDNLSV